MNWFMKMFRSNTPRKKERPVIVIKVEHPDSLEADLTPDMQKAIADFMKLSLSGRVLMSNLVQDSFDLDRQSTVPVGELKKGEDTLFGESRDYRCGYAAGYRAVLATILQICVVPQEETLKRGDSTTSDEITAALGSDYLIREEN